jgi:hypothetical protein
MGFRLQMAVDLLHEESVFQFIIGHHIPGIGDHKSDIGKQLLRNLQFFVDRFRNKESLN